MPDHDQTPLASSTSRRALVGGVVGLGVGIPLLAACGSDDSEGSAGGGDASSGSESGSGSGSGESGGGSTTSSGGIGTTDEVPVGGGKIFTSEKVVVTQPTEGDFKAFSALCTHQGCPVTKITGQEIDCTCHGSKFSITDGSVIQGPATEALEALKVTVKGTEITVA